MIKKQVTIGKTSRLSAAPAALLVQTASKYTAGFFVEQQDKQINAKSIMGVMTLKIVDGEVMTICADGNDEAEAIAEVEKLLTGK
ncbi:MAG: HPr family phosphocarrier protein [Lachnospiraceae bacterium]|jgi:catabolite repression HPr-like protein|nr:HPr family phosphocarrier protein [Lachnospiraceae bacterium]MBP5249566.1 HPr family phosphocarrier protein [Lachnospiraceae bacterium]MBR6359154.1 HPr family phosphocarrier protein [Lachnospiraceae bacterium]